MAFFSGKYNKFFKDCEELWWLAKSGVIAEHKNFEGITFLENIRNFFRVDFFYFMLGVGKCVISLHIPLLISQINLSSI